MPEPSEGTHELQHHDEGTGGRFRKAQAVHHFCRSDPREVLDRSLGDVRQDGVSPSKRDKRRLGEEFSFPDQHVFPATPGSQKKKRGQSENGEHHGQPKRMPTLRPEGPWRCDRGRCRRGLGRGRGIDCRHRHGLRIERGGRA